MSKNGYTPASEWRGQTTELFTFKSGKVALLQRPLPDIHLKFGRLPTHLLAVWQSASQQTDLEQSGMQFLSSMSDAELASFMLLARDVVQSVFKRPHIVSDREPQGDDEIAPEDITDEFWEAFMWGIAALGKVKMKGGDVQAKDIDSFRGESELPPVSENGEDVPTEAESTSRNP